MTEAEFKLLQRMEQQLHFLSAIVRLQAFDLMKKYPDCDHKQLERILEGLDVFN